MGMSLLLVEDDERVRRFIVKGLETEGYSVTEAEDGRTGLAKALSGQHDVIVLDVMLPGLDGRDLCRQLRSARVNTPVLMLTAVCATEDKVEGLRVGADDYLTKPFDFDEFLARIEALVRRASGALAGPPPNTQVGDIVIEREAMRVRRGGDTIELTSKEYQLLDLLVGSPGKVLSRSRILNRIWGYDTDPLTNVVDVYVRRLRAKLGWDLDSYIRTVRNYGYRLDP
jgi:two-component system, OmpR family, response regulator